jgi:hypothetical protein
MKTMPKDKPTWGGKRSNQNGRPPNRKGVLRVKIGTSVDPKTAEILRRKSMEESKSVGRILDETFL